MNCDSLQKYLELIALQQNVADVKSVQLVFRTDFMKHQNTDFIFVSNILQMV